MGRRSLVATLLLAACGPTPPASTDAGTDAGPPTLANVQSIFMTRACAVSTCHGGMGSGAARLNLQTAIAGGTLRTALVGVPACQYDAMPLVDPGRPENSWLYLKVAGGHTGTQVAFTPDPAWSHGLTPNPDGTLPVSQCPLTVSGRISFGAMMPLGSTGLDAATAAVIRDWIAMGAPP